jgi:hypothetical protein
MDIGKVNAITIIGAFTTYPPPPVPPPMPARSSILEMHDEYRKTGKYVMDG